MEHVGVCEEDVGLAAQPGAGRLGCVTVVDAKAGGTQLIMGQLVQAAELVLGEGLGGEEVEGTSAPVGEECLEYGNVVGQGLAAGGAGGQDDMPTLPGGVDGQRLVAVQPVGAGTAQGRFQRRRQRLLQMAIACLLRRQALDVDGLPFVAGQLGDLLDKGCGVHRRLL